MSIEANITSADHVFAGEDKQFRFTVVDSAGNPQTMTGWALEWVLRRSAAASTAVLTKTTGAGSIAITSGAGTDDRATVTVSDDDTLNLVTGGYEYALRRSDSGAEQVLAFGTFELLKAATR